MPDTRVRTSVWKGLNRMPFIADGEMRDMKNLCSDAYPYLTTRKGRKPYKFDIFIPSPEGEAYNTVSVLPTPSEAEAGNVYMITEDAEYMPGEFYYYSEGRWVQGVTGLFLGKSENADLSDYMDGATYYSSIESFNAYEKSHNGATAIFNGNIKKYIVNHSITMVNLGSNHQSDAVYCSSGVVPAASESILGKAYFTNISGTVTYYRCQILCTASWKQTEEKPYEAVAELPTEPAENYQIRYVGITVPMNGKYYLCQKDYIDTEKLFYAETDGISEYEELSYLPEATAENLGIVYLYTGVNVDEFAQCVYQNGEYIWKKISHPKVLRTVGLEEYLKEYKEIKLKAIIEITAFLGKMAVLFETDTGEIKLYYDEKVWSVNNVTREAGNKLTVAGNKLIVGESGSYLHINNKGVTSFHTSTSSFAVTVTASYAEYGNGGEKAKWSSAHGDAESGEATFVIVAQGNQGFGFEMVYSGLKVKGTDFSVEFDGKTYYLSSESVTFEKNAEIYAWKVNAWHYDYADILTIKATGVMEDFEWNNTGTGHPLYMTFASTEPHYYDVVTWKKRLWGYKDNVLFGTAADIFDSKETVDWNRGDNTYLEAISQPIWQGGNITGLAALSNALILFKEDSLTVFTGNYPAIMSGSTIPCRGLSEENRESVAVGNESVFYLSQDGVYRFMGGIPQCISRNEKIFGSDAVGISDGNKYWLSLKENGKPVLYVYDANFGVWHKEDDFRARSFTMIDGDVFAADEKEIYNINASQEDVEWEMVLWFDEGTHKKKKYKELSFRGHMGDCELQIKGDEGEWQAIRWTEDKLCVKLTPFLCEEFMVKLKGRGICQIKSLDRTFEVIE